MTTKTRTPQINSENCNRSTNSKKLVTEASTANTPESWRLRCPNGHSNWRRSGDAYQCLTGIEYDYSCATFHQLVDAKSGVVVTR